MMSKILWVTMVSIFLLSQSFAIYNPDASLPEEWEINILATTMPAPVMQSSYENKEDFEKVEWYICKTATDGVNTFMMKDGEVFAGTKVGYPQNFTAEWKCVTYIGEDMLHWSQNDRNHFNALLSNIDEGEMNKVNYVLERIHLFLDEKSLERKQMYHEAILELIDTQKMKIILEHPQDIALPEEVSKVYNMLSLLRYLLMVS